MTNINLTEEALLKAAKLLENDFGHPPVSPVEMVQEIIAAALSDAGYTVTAEPVLSIQEATAKIAALTTEARSLISQAEQLANLYDLSFSFDITYGAGATYSDGDWCASSQQC